MSKQRRPVSSVKPTTTPAQGGGRTGASTSNAAMLETLNGSPQLGMDSDWGASVLGTMANTDVVALFGETTNALSGSPHLQVVEGAQVEDGASLGSLRGQQLLTGLIAEGWCTEGDSAEEALANQVDEGGVEFIVITDPRSGASFDWLRFYMGDTEVGYFFTQGTTDLVGKVGDGDIYAA